MARRLLCDPGGIEIFPAVFSALSAECDPTKLAGIFASHQDPDIISSLALWLSSSPISRYTSWLWQSFLPHFGGEDSTFVPIPDPGMTIKLGGLELQADSGHYLHSSGQSPPYDPKAKILFSGDIGAACCRPTRAGFTWRIFPATSATRRFSTSAGWVPTGPSATGASAFPARDRHAGAPARRIYQGADVQRFINWFAALEVGVLRG